MKKIFFLLSIISIAISARAEDEHYVFGRTIRSKGMGGVYVPFAKPDDAVLVNPAFLGSTNEIAWNMVNLGAAINGVDTWTQLSQVSGSSGLTGLYGKNIYLGVSGRSSVVAPHFGISVYEEARISAQLHNPAYPYMDMNFINDYGASLGSGFQFGAMSAGFALKRVTRTGGNQQIGLDTLTSVSSSSSLTSQFQNAGVGYGMDLGFNYTLPVPTSPTFSLVWYDVGYTSFIANAGSSAPPLIKDNLTFAYGSTVDLPGLDMAWGLEYRHIRDTDIQLGKKLHFGTELSIPFVDLRAGVSQGYTSYGLGFSLFFIDFDAVMYKEEVGVYPGQLAEDRLEFGMNIEFGFDADFKFSAKDGKKRKLKQRR